MPHLKIQDVTKFKGQIFRDDTGDCNTIRKYSVWSGSTLKNELHAVLELASLQLTFIFLDMWFCERRLLQQVYENLSLDIANISVLTFNFHFTDKFYSS